MEPLKVFNQRLCDMSIEEKKEYLDSVISNHHPDEYGLWNVGGENVDSYCVSCAVIQGHLDDTLAYISETEYFWELDTIDIEKIEITKRLPQRISPNCDDVI